MVRGARWQEFRRSTRLHPATRRSVTWVLCAAALVLLWAARVHARKPVTSPLDYHRHVFPLLREPGRCHVDGGVGPMSNVSLPQVAVNTDWRLGTPDLTVTMEAVHTMAPGTLDEVIDTVLPVGNDAAGLVRAADFQPGTPSIVRDATISVEDGPRLAVWQPGSDVQPAPEGMAFELPARARIHLQVHYKKHADQEQSTLTDKSTIGLYLAPPGARVIRSLVVAPSGVPEGVLQSISASFSHAARIVALTPLLDRSYGSIDVTAVGNDGSRTPLLELRRPRPQRFYRFWLDRPVDVTPGTVIRIALQPMPDSEDDRKTLSRFPLSVGVNYVDR